MVHGSMLSFDEALISLIELAETPLAPDCSLHACVILHVQNPMLPDSQVHEASESEKRSLRSTPNLL